MSKKTRSARGEPVDFDLLSIKQQLASKPVPVSVDQRRRFIDEKDGVKQKTDRQAQPEQEIPDALSISLNAARESEEASDQ